MAQTGAEPSEAEARLAEESGQVEHDAHDEGELEAGGGAEAADDGGQEERDGGTGVEHEGEGGRSNSACSKSTKNWSTFCWVKWRM